MCQLSASEVQDITQILNKWPQDINQKNVPAVCGLFAPDLIASYQGAPDKNYDQMCQQLIKAINDPEKTFHYQAPQIEDILIQGDLAVVRLIWTLEVTSKEQTVLEEVKEKGLDVFRRQKDGSWKIIISYAYPL